MPIRYHPKRGSILICDFTGFHSPEMTKRRPVIVISPKIKSRAGLCTVVALSATEPQPIEPFHCTIQIDPPLPFPYDKPQCWVKGDMLYTVSFDRLRFPFQKNPQGKRIPIIQQISAQEMILVETCVLAGIGIQ